MYELDDEELSAGLDKNAFVELPITWRHARRAGSLPRYHDDPFDRIRDRGRPSGPLSF